MAFGKAGLLAMCCLSMSTPALAAQYFVATSGDDVQNPGSYQEPFRTVRRGVGALNPGDTLYIRGGVYAEEVVENDFGATGNSGAWILVAGYPGESVTIRNPGSGSVFRFQDGSKHHIELRDLIIDGGGLDQGGGIWLSGFPPCCGDQTVSHDIKLTNLEVKDTYLNGILAGGNNHQFINLNVHGCGRVPPEVYEQGANGVYFAGDDALFIGGSYSDNSCYGLRVADSGSHGASNNLITRVRVANNGVGKGLGGSSRCARTGGGIVTGDTNNTVENSLIYNNVTGISLQGLGGKVVQQCKIYNNTIYQNSGPGLENGLWAGANGTQIFNNIFYLNGSTIDENGTGTVLSHNITTEDPRFTSASTGDFTLSPGSPAIDRGTAIATVRTDFNGSPRPFGAEYDIGAYEFGAAAARPSSPLRLRVLP